MARSQGLLCPGQSFKFKYLSVKWVVSQSIDALEGASVALIHNQAVLRATEKFRFVYKFQSSHGATILLLSSHNNVGLPFPSPSKSCGVLLISVLIDHLWKP